MTEDIIELFEAATVWTLTQLCRAVHFGLGWLA
jgi:hypothetical protein